MNYTIIDHVSSGSFFYQYFRERFGKVISRAFHRIGPLGRFDLVVAMSVVCMCACVSVPFRVVYFEAYFSPTSQSCMSKIFRDSESLGKSAGKKWSQNSTFLLGSGLKSPRKKSLCFSTFALQIWWKPRFPMEERLLVKGYIANFGISLEVFEFFSFGLFFPFLFFFGFCEILVHPTVVSVLLSASVERFNVSRMPDF